MCLIGINELSAAPDVQMYLSLLLNGVLLLLAYPLLYGIERVFGFTSNVTLVELSNTNNRLLRRLSEEAPGTFQHTIQVSNLAAAAADRIGANAQLVRTGALYHDIGKLSNPQFFTENQNGLNPNDQLSYEQAAKVVIAHVPDGLRLAEQAKLPRMIKDFISTHHGKGVAKYFLVSWQNEHPDQKPDREKFTYPGPNPMTRETAILMMADGIEAASRSLSEHTDESLSALIDRIIDGQMEEGFFRDCPLTFRDIPSIKAVFREKLRSIYHPRVNYPEAR
jgi:putative nucleotidyltransferase with HDIG domain